MMYQSILFVVFATLFTILYTTQKEQLLHQEEQTLEKFALSLEEQLKKYHFYHPEIMPIHTQGYRIAFFDKDGAPVAQNDKTLEKKEGYANAKVTICRNVTIPFLGISTIVVAKPYNFSSLIVSLLIFIVPLWLIMVGVGFYLVRIAMKPAHAAFDTIDTFIKHATHDLNTPISLIISNARLLEERKNCEEKDAMVVSRILAGAKTLSHLYDDLVYLSFQTPLQEPKRVNIAELIHERLHYFQPLFHTKELILTLNLEESFLYITPEDFYRLFDNIVTNAVKYTKKGGTIAVSCINNRLEIRDNGIGLLPEEKTRILERYYRGTNFEKGLGIGMEIVVRICHAYRLTLAIESQKNQGSTFCITWEN